MKDSLKTPYQNLNLEVYTLAEVEPAGCVCAVFVRAVVVALVAVVAVDVVVVVVDAVVVAVVILSSHIFQRQHHHRHRLEKLPDFQSHYQHLMRLLKESYLLPKTKAVPRQKSELRKIQSPAG